MLFTNVPRHLSGQEKLASQQGVPAIPLINLQEKRFAGAKALDQAGTCCINTGVTQEILANYWSNQYTRLSALRELLQILVQCTESKAKLD